MIPRRLLYLRRRPSLQILAETERQEALKLKPAVQEALKLKLVVQGVLKLNMAVQEALKREPALLKAPRLLQERIRAVG